MKLFSLVILLSLLASCATPKMEQPKETTKLTCKCNYSFKDKLKNFIDEHHMVVVLEASNITEANQLCTKQGQSPDITSFDHRISECN
ncbi:MAG: hypothetical protein A2504_10005 [Bdellovibrionales bacterium RIFOXYD12_FULL_39_22]|nr:MAG: hypothetical protein A2385_17640 [Bdellovibrionales bacterium RIFOXYB1_FULL_39_21]OFZ43943.1 MAG: hypothetical protein A2485_04310 [Bdellovibrionales bacterium RIFOXYC12_FULL_39_17]OFZ48315.1 MAG: hypothetical protein A2404_01725 [Bdellovibrionales bacterium RIFOXYC1_FULL_39_130]OFZ94906.1 MAG: hypothetical protein A2504_10005 [Bdellovibrionales bacterium RIFOXYD12_FULL_39_22]HLE12672.1 hypothetical protein [Bacteriovoracaceae bacterium]